jgi:signal peptidase I
VSGAQEPEGPHPRLSGLWEQVGTLLVAILVALLFRQLVMEPFRIPSGSMLPTLLVGDHLFVNKFAYGARVPFSNARLPAWREPQRGDIVVFAVGSDGIETLPADRTDLPREDFVKRIVGLPGDRIEFRDGALFVNDAALERRRTDRVVPDESGRSLPVYEVALAERSFAVLDDPRRRDPVREPFVVEPGRYYVLGDNRDNSKDSRFWGTVRREEIKGPAFLVYWSWDYQGGWLDLANPLTWWRTEKRWERVGARL